jgi:hypothetical protein
MLYFRTPFHHKLLGIWKSYYTNSNEDDKLLLIYVINEVILQTNAKFNEEYIQAFGDILEETFKQYIEYVKINNSSTKKVETLKYLSDMCDLWEVNRIYAKEFLDYIRKLLLDRTELLNKNDRTSEGIIQRAQLKADIRQCYGFDLSRIILEGNIREHAIR